LSEEHARWRENLQGELDGVAVYEGLAALDDDRARAATLRHIAEDERRHAEIWKRKLLAAGLTIPPFRASTRTRLLLGLARVVGTGRVIGLVMEIEARDAARYTKGDAESQQIAAEEDAHRETLGALGGPATPRARIAGRETWHRAGRSSSLRAAVFGVNDGIVSNLSLVLGVAGAGVDLRTILITGMSGLLAGAASMAVGEYVSVASQRDLLQRQIELERRELIDAPEEERAELIGLFQGKGLSVDEATRLADRLMEDPEQALDTIVREELGLDPEDLGSPTGAAVASFFMFAGGAVVPLLPFLLLPANVATGVSVALVLTVLAGIGALLGVLAGTSPLASGARMAGLAALAAGITWGLGSLVGARLD
jgi:VIT1/CCC1 family predicted Fe2+/Mn2+ transporter